jgi:hypothetical protein
MNKLLSDLEIYNKIIPKIDHTITTFGTIKFKSLFDIYHHDSELLKRQTIIKNIIKAPKSTSKKIRKLKIIKNLEKDIDWLFNEELHKKKYDDLYFSSDYLNIRELLSLTNFLKTYSPMFVFIVYIIVYMMFKYMGISVDIVSYMKHIYMSYQLMISSFLYLFIDNQKMVSLLCNILSSCYVFYQLYASYSSVEVATNHYMKCTNFKEKFNNIRLFLDTVNDLINKDKNIIYFYNNNKSSINNYNYHNHQLINNKKIELMQTLNRLKGIFNCSSYDFFSFGKLLLIKKEVDYIRNEFNILLDYVGTIDAFINLSKLVTVGGFCFPAYDYASKKPYIKSKDLWSLYVNNFNEQKINDCKMGKNIPNTMVLTGPNTSGKSTYIRNILLTILCAQTICISPCTSIVFTPFYNLFTYLDIPNISRNRESLFEAEVNRCMEFCNTLENMPSNKFTFTIMDELFTGTNPEEGIASSYSVSEYLGHFDNSIMIITTHFTELTKLAYEYPKRFMNKKFFVVKNPNGTFYRPYTIANGVSDQNIAIELLKNKGYNSIIIDRAQQFLNKHNMVFEDKNLI